MFWDASPRCILASIIYHNYNFASRSLPLKLEKFLDVKRITLSMMYCCRVLRDGEELQKEDQEAAMKWARLHEDLKQKAEEIKAERRAAAEEAKREETASAKVEEEVKQTVFCLK